MEHLLISNARHLRQVNVFGVKKIMRNILALQQSIKTFTNEQKHTEFERAKRYYSLFFMSPTVSFHNRAQRLGLCLISTFQDMLDSIREKQLFSFDEYKTMLDLQCGVNQREGLGQATDRNYSMYVIDLHGLELGSSDDP
jgi:exocyst complex component 4